MTDDQISNYIPPVHWLILTALCLCVAQQGYAADDGVPVAFTMPHAGRATIAIDNAQGQRVRNLAADVALEAGARVLPWDGLDDQGHVLPAGDYRWVGLAHDDLHALFRTSFTTGDPPWEYGQAGAWTADHASPNDVLALGDRIYIGSHTTEGGSGLVCTDLNGKKLWGVKWLNGTAWQGVDTMATDGERIFAKGRPEWHEKDLWHIWEVDPASGKSWFVVSIPYAAPGHEPAAAPFAGVASLRVVGARRTGATRWAGELYVSDVLGEKPRTFVYSTAKAAETDTGYDNEHPMPLLRVLPVWLWSMAWLPDGRCLAATDDAVVFLNTQTGEMTPLVKDGLQAPYDIAVDAKGRIFVSDWGGSNPPRNPNRSVLTQGRRPTPQSSMQVKVFDARGKLLRAMGKPGGSGEADGNHERQGPIDPRDFFFPAGLTIDSQGRLWVTELTIQPKRVSVWSIPDDLASNPAELAAQFYGRPQYGEGATMPDPSQPNRLLTSCQGVLWDVNLQTGRYRPIERRYNDDVCGGMFRGIPVERTVVEGRTFARLADWGFDQNVLGEVKGTQFVPLASFGTVLGVDDITALPEALKRALRQHPDWPKAARDARIDPSLEKIDDQARERWPVAFSAFHWTDANGDGLWQPEEIVFRAMHFNAPVSWKIGPGLKLYVDLHGHQNILEPQGFNKAGAPQYDWALHRATSLRSIGHRAQPGPDGSAFYPRSMAKVMRLVGPDGRERWHYPVASTDGGYSQFTTDQILQPGAIHGEQGLQGVVPGPNDLGDIIMIKGWQGMVYFLTRDDGLYIGSVFKPHQAAPVIQEIAQAMPGMRMENYSLGGENFGGSLARAQATRAGFEAAHYYLLGYSFNLVIELTGLENAQRLPGGSITLSAQQVEYNRLAAIEAAEKKFAQRESYATIDIGPGREHAADVPLDNPNWLTPHLQLWHTPQGLNVEAVYGAAPGSFDQVDQLFTSNTAAWEQAYAAGDAMFLDLASDPQAAPARTRAAPGDQRIVFTSMDGKPVVVRYRWMAVKEAAPQARVLDIGRQGDKAWVAEKLDVPANLRRSATVSHAEVVLSVTLPWKLLGLDYKEDLKFRGNAGVILKQDLGLPPWQSLWVGDTTRALTSPAAALEEMRPSLWSTLAIRPAAYPPAPDMRRVATATTGLPLLVRKRPAAAEPAHFADAFAWLSHDKAGLHLRWYVTKDASPFINKGTDWTALFKTGDGCDLQIASPALGPCRYLVSMFEGNPVVVRYVYRDKPRNADSALTDPATNEPELDAGVVFKSPVSEVLVPRVERLEITPTVQRGDDWYTVDVVLPWDVLMLKPSAGTVAAELGVLRSDGAGGLTVRRDYWHSGLSGMVQDVPTEVAPTANWGEFRFE